MPLMQLAGEAAARHAIALSRTGNETFVCVAGPGNNGGDAIVVAETLRREGWRVALVAPWPARISAMEAPAQQAFSTYVTAAGAVSPTWNIDTADAGCVVVDGLLGIGATRAPDGVMAALIARVNLAFANGARVLALDVPSGLDADTGAAAGAVVQATRTVSFIAGKVGLHTGIGPRVAGKTVVEILRESAHVERPAATLIDTASLKRLGLPERHATAHKGSQGTVAVVGGADGMVGAPILAGRAALIMGAGKVRVGVIGSAPLYDAGMPELMIGPASDVGSADAWVVGPGIGRSDRAVEWVRSAIANSQQLVVDADALNIIATADASQHSALANRTSSVVLTPHPLEAARLLHMTTAQVQQNRLGAAVALAQRFNAVVVLKGAGTVIAAPGEIPAINATGNAALASAGTGDVLAGMIGAMLARGLSPWSAACVAVVLHGAAADLYREQVGGVEGLTASAVAPLAAAVMNRAQMLG